MSSGSSKDPDKYNLCYTSVYSIVTIVECPLLNDSECPDQTTRMLMLVLAFTVCIDFEGMAWPIFTIHIWIERPEQRV